MDCDHTITVHCVNGVISSPLTTRIAPAPSGMFHIGTARTAYHNWLAARASKGRFLVRIDDTNPELCKDEYIEAIYNALNWLGLGYDDTFRQSQRLERYKAVVQELRDRGLVREIEGGALALKQPPVPEQWWDQILGWVKIGQEERERCDGLVVVRSDGSPTYHLATVVDDHDFGINFIIRGQDHVSNTARQTAIYRALGWLVPIHAHVGLIHKDKKKLSKRDGASSLLEYRDKGYESAAMLNYLLRLGWGPYVDDKTANYIPQDRAIQMFLKDGQLRPASSNFDQAKLDWLDRKYKAAKRKTDE